MHNFTVCILTPVVDKEWPSKDDSRRKRSAPTETERLPVYKRQVTMPGTMTDDCCVNGTKGEKGTQGKYPVKYTYTINSYVHNIMYHLL